jgi:hypothetical protein
LWKVRYFLQEGSIKPQFDRGRRDTASRGPHIEMLIQPKNS